MWTFYFLEGGIISEVKEISDINKKNQKVLN